MRRVMQMGLAQVIDWFAPVFDDLKEMVDDRLTTAQLPLPLKPDDCGDGLSSGG